IEQDLGAAEVLFDEERRDRQVLADGVEAAVVGVLRQGTGDEGTGMLRRRNDRAVEVDGPIRFGGVGNFSDLSIALGDCQIAEGVPVLADIQPPWPQRAGVGMAVERVPGQGRLDPGSHAFPLLGGRLGLVGRRHLPRFDPVPNQLPDLGVSFFPHCFQIQSGLWLLLSVAPNTILHQQRPDVPGSPARYAPGVIGSVSRYQRPYGQDQDGETKIARHERILPSSPRVATRGLPDQWLNRNSLVFSKAHSRSSYGHCLASAACCRGTSAAGACLARNSSAIFSSSAVGGREYTHR